MTKEQLRQYKYIKREIDNLRQLIQELEEVTCTAKTIKYDATPGRSGNGSTVENAIIRLDEIKNRYMDKVVILAKTLDEIVNVIDSLTDEPLRTLMKLHYIEGFRWEDIADKMGYSWRHIHRLHAKALLELKDK